MDQCSQWHDIPSALQATSPNRPGHDLALGINIHPSRQQYSPASGSMISVPRIRAQTPQRHADRLPLVDLFPEHDGYEVPEDYRDVRLSSYPNLHSDAPF